MRELSTALAGDVALAVREVRSCDLHDAIDTSDIRATDGPERARVALPTVNPATRASLLRTLVAGPVYFRNGFILAGLF